MAKVKKTAKAVAKKKVGHNEGVPPEAAPSVYDRVIEILGTQEESDEGTLTSEEIAGRISGDWTPAELTGALQYGCASGAIRAHDPGDCDGPILYSLATAATPPIDEAAVLAEARVELDRVLAREDRPRATRLLECRLTDVARGGVEHRDVECHEIVLWARGVAVTFRADTCEEIERRTLEAADERQGALFPGAP